MYALLAYKHSYTTEVTQVRYMKCMWPHCIASAYLIKCKVATIFSPYEAIHTLATSFDLLTYWDIICIYYMLLITKAPNI